LKHLLDPKLELNLGNHQEIIGLLQKKYNNIKGYHLDMHNKDFYGGFPIQKISANSGEEIKVAVLSAPLYED
jgi:hypothetical protein